MLMYPEGLWAVQKCCTLFSINKKAVIPQTDTHLLQNHNKPRGWWQLGLYNHKDGEESQDVGLHCRQDQPRAEGQTQLRGAGVVQRPPNHQREVGDQQRVEKHHSPGPDHRPQLPEGEEQQVELQNYPGMA